MYTDNRWKKEKSVKPSFIKASVGRTTSVGDRQIKFVFSTPQMDRDYDVIEQEGIGLDLYSTNPVVYFSHAHDTLPIGRTISLGIEDGCLQGIIEFVPADNPEVGQKAEGIYRLARDGYLNAVSIGFIATEWKYSDDKERWDREGADIQKCELVEVSIVGIPSNRGALIQEVGTPEVVREPDAPVFEQPKTYHAPRLKRLLDALD